MAIISILRHYAAADDAFFDADYAFIAIFIIRCHFSAISAIDTLRHYASCHYCAAMLSIFSPIISFAASAVRHRRADYFHATSVIFTPIFLSFSFSLIAIS